MNNQQTNSEQDSNVLKQYYRYLDKHLVTKDVTSFHEVDIENDIYFTYFNTVFVRDDEVLAFYRDFLKFPVKALYGTEYRSGASVNCNHEDKHTKIDIGALNIVLFLDDGRIIQFENREWARRLKVFDK